MTALALAEVKQHLNISSSSDDAELLSFLARAEAAIATRCGPLELTSTTERVRGGRSMLTVRESPINSLTSVTPVSGSALDTSLLVVSSRAGVIEYLSGSRFGSRWYDVVYQAGWSPLPKDLRGVVLETVDHMWTSQRVGRAPGSPIGMSESNTLPGAGFQFPFPVTQAMAPFEKAAI